MNNTRSVASDHAGGVASLEALRLPVAVPDRMLLWDVSAARVCLKALFAMQVDPISPTELGMMIRTRPHARSFSNNLWPM